MAEESFISHGIFGEPAQSTAHVQLSGVLLSAARHTCSLTGQGFSVATVRTFGFQAALCLADTEHPATPEPGNIISGTVFLTASLDLDVP